VSEGTIPADADMIAGSVPKRAKSGICPMGVKFSANFR